MVAIELSRSITINRKKKKKTGMKKSGPIWLHLILAWRHMTTESVTKFNRLVMNDFITLGNPKTPPPLLVNKKKEARDDFFLAQTVDSWSLFLTTVPSYYLAGHTP